MIPLFKVYMDKDVNESLIQTLYSGWIGQGEKVKEFEDLLGNTFGNPYCLSLSAGTHGLHLALRMLGVREGDNVVTTALTCTATNWPILMQGADIVWADIKKEDLNIDPKSIKEKINQNTKAVMVMHWGGYPCDMEEIFNVCDSRGIPIIEDAAHAFGSTYKEEYIGSCQYSHFTMMSFQAIKHLTTVDGGALFCREEGYYDYGKLLRWYGIDRESPRIDMRCEEDIPDWGYKYHMNDICATIGLANFRSALKNVEKARDNAKYYREQLKDFDGIQLLEESKTKKSSYWLFTIYVEDRLGFARHMGERGIMVSRVHERNDKHSCVKKFKTHLPNVDYAVQSMICIPVGWWITKEDREYIISSIKEGW